MDVISGIKEAIKGAKRAFVFSHVNPDADAIGSLVSFGRLIELQGVNDVDLFVWGGVPERFKEFPFWKPIKDKLELSEKPDLIAIVDCGGIDRLHKSFLEKIEPLLENTTTVNIDHHRTNTRFADFNLVSENAPSTSFLIWKIYKELGIQIPSDIAQWLYAGLVGDTGSFKYSNTTSEAFDMGLDLMNNAGLVPSQVAQKVFCSDSLKGVKFQSAMLANLRTFNGSRIAGIVILPKDMAAFEVSSDDIEGLVEKPLRIRGVQCSYLIRPNGDGRYKGSLRAKSEALSVSEIAEFFGGGGHKSAAGFYWKGDNPYELEQSVVTRLSEVIERVSNDGLKME